MQIGIRNGTNVVALLFFFRGDNAFVSEVIAALFRLGSLRAYENRGGWMVGVFDVPRQSSLVKGFAAAFERRSAPARYLAEWLKGIVRRMLCSSAIH